MIFHTVFMIVVDYLDVGAAGYAEIGLGDDTVGEADYNVIGGVGEDFRLGSEKESGGRGDYAERWISAFSISISWRTSRPRAAGARPGTTITDRRNVGAFHGGARGKREGQRSTPGTIPIKEEPTIGGPATDNSDRGRHCGGAVPNRYGGGGRGGGSGVSDYTGGWIRANAALAFVETMCETTAQVSTSRPGPLSSFRGSGRSRFNRSVRPESSDFTRPVTTPRGLGSGRKRSSRPP